LYCPPFVITGECKVKVEAEKLDIPKPCILVRGSLANPNNSCLIVERRELFKVDFDKIPVVLLAALIFHTFDIHHTLSLFKVFLGNKLPKEKIWVHHFKARLFVMHWLLADLEWGAQIDQLHHRDSLSNIISQIVILQLSNKW